MEQIYMYTPAVHALLRKLRPMPQSLMFLVPYTTLAPTLVQRFKKALFGPLDTQ